MSRREVAAIVVLLVIVLALAAFWPAPRAAGDTPILTTPIPSSAFVPIQPVVGTPRPVEKPAPSPSAPHVVPSVAPVRSPAAPSTGVSSSPAASVTGHLSGRASFMDPAYGPRYLALPGGPGITVTICSVERCIRRTSTDAGPDLAMQRAGRVADLSFADFAFLCDCDPWKVGLTDVEVSR